MRAWKGYKKYLFDPFVETDVKQLYCANIEEISCLRIKIQNKLGPCGHDGGK